MNRRIGALTVRLVLSTLAVLTVLVPTTAARADAGFRQGEVAPGFTVPLRASSRVPGRTLVGSDRAPRVSPRSATITVTYHGFSTAAKNAFQAAVNIWKSKLTSPVAIKIDANFTDLGATTGILGSAGPVTFHRDFTGAKANTWYPQAIANKIAGRDLAPSDPDISADFNDQFPNWFFGTSGQTPADKYDFETVVLHELGHGLGFLLSFRQSGNAILHSESAGGVTSPFIQDGFATNSSGQKANRFPSGSTQFKTAVTSDNLFWKGSKGMQANGGHKPRLYAPNPFEPGSSASHLDEEAFPQGDPDSLMTPFLDTGERIVNPGPIALGILNDSGWATASK